MTANELLKQIPSIYSNKQIEASLAKVFLQQKGLVCNARNSILEEILQSAIDEICHIVSKGNPELTLKLIENVFEGMIDSQEKRENGVVFTPEYIVEYIIKNSVNGYATENCRIIDPACGSGSFLVLTAEHLAHTLNKPMSRIISENIYGIDINEDNVRRSKILLTLLTLSYDNTAEAVSFHILETDSLKSDWAGIFDCEHFDFILGNPPYVNTHDMSKETISYLKSNFVTTQKGTFNIFYAFIEQSMKFLAKDGALGFIIPNNYLTITAAESLRHFLVENQYVSQIIDFGDNMIFAPVRTYNSLLFLNKQKKDTVQYATIEKTENVKKTLSTTKLLTLPICALDSTGWKLLTAKQRENIYRIENVGKPIKPQIKVGIATLRDNVYLLDGYDPSKNMYYKHLDGEMFYIEPGIVRSIYKISNIKAEDSLLHARQHIVFPYQTSSQVSLFDTKSNAYAIIPEEYMMKNFPLCYKYLTACKAMLDSRDKGKGNAVAWYAYGRSQGLGYICKKLLFPTFSNRPKFMLEDSNDALFCNGYAVIDGGSLDLILMQKILNSSIMDYYISMTSYAIEGNYKCYQKKYIQNFSLPEFSQDEKDFLLDTTDCKQIDSFLMDKYCVSI